MKLNRFAAGFVAVICDDILTCGMPWEVYIIETESGRLYTGIAKSSMKRFAEHAGSSKKGAKYFRFDRPIKIVYVEKTPNRSVALKREYQIKSMSRKDKLALICP